MTEKQDTQQDALKQKDDQQDERGKRILALVKEIDSDFGAALARDKQSDKNELKILNDILLNFLERKEPSYERVRAANEYITYHNDAAHRMGMEDKKIDYRFLISDSKNIYTIENDGTKVKIVDNDIHDPNLPAKQFIASKAKLTSQYNQNMISEITESVNDKTNFNPEKIKILDTNPQIDVWVSNSLKQVIISLDGIPSEDKSKISLPDRFRAHSDVITIPVPKYNYDKLAEGYGVRIADKSPQK